MSIEIVDDWHLRMTEILPGEYQISICEPAQQGKDYRIIKKTLTITEAMDLHDVGGAALRHIARMFR